VRFIIAGLLGLGAGKGVELVLGSFPTATAYGLLHVCAFALMAGSYLIFASIREPRAAQHEQQPERRWVDFLRSNVPTILGDVQIRRYIGARVLMNGIFVFLPFLGIHALQTLGLPDSFLGYLLGAQMAGGLLGNVLGGTLGDRSGARLPMLTSLSVYALLCMWAPFGSTDIEFIVLFAAFGAAAAMHGTSVPTLDLEICPPDRRIACQAVLGMSNLLGILLFSLLAGAIRSVTTSFANLALPALVSICLSVILVYGIREPRRILA
jgi:MFS family permease